MRDLTVAAGGALTGIAIACVVVWLIQRIVL